MGVGARMIISVMRAVKKTGLMKGPGEDIDKEFARARAYNEKHRYKEPSDGKAHYRTEIVGGYPCLEIRQQESETAKAILFLHGGGDSDTWKPEVSFAHRYGKLSGMDVIYPLYPPFSEVSLAGAADLIFEVYQKTVKGYGADNVAVIGGSYGGLLAMQLLTLINRNGDKMPRLLIMNSPFGFPKSPEEWKFGEELEWKDAMLPIGAMRYMLNGALRADPDTPDYLLYPDDMDFRNAPETYVFYAEEVCMAVAESIKRRYESDGAGERLHMHIEPGMIHCYASAPVFKESRRDFNRQIELLKSM